MNKTVSRISSFFPSGIAYLASYLESNGFEVRVFDFQTLPRKSLKAHGFLPYLKREIDSFNPDIVGIGCLFSHYLPSIKEIVRDLKALKESMVIVLGGLHPTLYYEKLMAQLQAIDFIILGEGEVSFLALCKKLKENAKTFSDIDGLAYREGGEIKVNQKMSFIERLDDLPFPAFDKFNMETYMYHIRYNRKNRGMSVITSRSCPQRCTFCSMFHSHGRKWRTRSAANVLDEIELLYHKYDIRNFQFMDDNMTFNKERTISICRGILDRGMNITFFFPNGMSINTLDREVIEVMKEAGCVEIRLPIESGSEHLRNKIMKKGLSNKKIFEVIEACNDLNLPTVGYFIVGMPGEDHKTMQENVDFVKQLKGRRFVDFLGTNFAIPFPGTALYKQCVEEELIDDKTMEQLMDGTITIFDQPIIRLKTITEEELIEHRKQLWEISFKQNFFRILRRYSRPTRNNYQIFRALVHRFVVGY
jgi:magnesium-protoporphyrin IX monomethyl ester (oxidative) cyclase